MSLPLPNEIMLKIFNFLSIYSNPRRYPYDGSFAKAGKTFNSLYTIKEIQPLITGHVYIFASKDNQTGEIDLHYQIQNSLNLPLEAVWKDYLTKSVEYHKCFLNGKNPHKKAKLGNNSACLEFKESSFKHSLILFQKRYNVVVIHLMSWMAHLTQLKKLKILFDFLGEQDTLLHYRLS